MTINQLKRTPHNPIKPIPAPVLKTPENQRRNARNYYRKKKDIPLDAPLRTRAEPFNKRRRGTGNSGGKVSMPVKAWVTLDQLRGDLTRGEYIQTLLEHTAS